jgi:hypothetical protein
MDCAYITETTFFCNRVFFLFKKIFSWYFFSSGWVKPIPQPAFTKMDIDYKKASALIAQLGNGEIHTMTTRRPLRTRTKSTLRGEKESRQQIRAVAYENTAKTKAIREAGVQRSETPSGYETAGLEEFGGKVLRNIKSGNLHLNVAFVRALDSRYVVDGETVELDSIASELLGSETKKRAASVKVAPNGEELETQAWTRPKIASIVGIDLG